MQFKKQLFLVLLSLLGANPPLLAQISTGWTNITYVGAVFSYANAISVQASSSPSTHTNSGWGTLPTYTRDVCPNPYHVQWLPTNPMSKTWFQMVMTARALGLKVRFEVTCEPTNSAYAWVSYVIVGEN
jgi:hypothetical protein